MLSMLFIVTCPLWGCGNTVQRTEMTVKVCILIPDVTTLPYHLDDNNNVIKPATLLLEDTTYIKDIEWVVVKYKKY